MKRKIVNVEPISSNARNRFKTKMESFHSCYVDNETDSMFFLSSINKQYYFVVNKQNESHWRFVK
jgi:hypothetical protein